MHPEFHLGMSHHFSVAALATSQLQVNVGGPGCGDEDGCISYLLLHNKLPKTMNIYHITFPEARNLDAA